MMETMLLPPAHRFGWSPSPSPCPCGRERLVTDWSQTPRDAQGLAGSMGDGRHVTSGSRGDFRWTAKDDRGCSR